MTNEINVLALHLVGGRLNPEPAMSDNDRIRRELGTHLIEAERKAGVRPQPVPKPESKPQKPERVVTILDND